MPKIAFLITGSVPWYNLTIICYMYNVPRKTHFYFIRLLDF